MDPEPVREKIPLPKPSSPELSSHQGSTGVSWYRRIEADFAGDVLGECEFKTPMPDNVRSAGYTSFIKKHTAVLLTDDEVTQFVSAIQTGKCRRES
jgi:hypothetical protein